MALEINFMYDTNSWLKYNGYTLMEEIDLYKCSLQDVVDNPRWYLDNLHYLREFKVRWKCYTLGIKGSPTVVSTGKKGNLYK